MNTYPNMYLWWISECIFLLWNLLIVCGLNENQYFGRPSYESTWYDIAAQEQDVLSIPHNLGEYPVKVDVQVRVKENDKYYIFTGLTSAQADDDVSAPFGGVIYAYNQEEILVSVTRRSNDKTVGGVAYTGSSTYYHGPSVVRGPYYQGSVKVRIWLCRDMPKLVLNMSSEISITDTYKEIVHGLGYFPDIVTVQLLMPDGYIAEAGGAVMNLDQSNSNSLDLMGTIFGYDDTVLRLWTSGIAVFGANDGWNMRKSSKSADVQIYAWKIDNSQKVFQDSFPIGKTLNHNDTVVFPRKYDLSNYLVSVKVHVQNTLGNTMVFNAVGSSLAYGYSHFGGIVYVYTKQEVYLWRPDTGNGHVVYIGGLWGSGQERMISDIGDVNITVYYLSDHCFSNSSSPDGCIPDLIDILFLVDRSSSEINQTDTSIKFLNETISKLSLGINEFQVALMTYNFKSDVIFDFNQHDKSAITSFVLTIEGEDMSTFTATALRNAVQVLRNCSSGSRGNGILQYIVLLSDGLSSETNTVKVATDIQNDGGRIVTVAIGNSIKHSELRQISGRSDYVFCAKNPDHLFYTLLKEALDPSCIDCRRNSETDVLFLLDTSRNQTRSDFKLRQYAVGKVMAKTPTLNNDTMFSLLQYSDEPDMVFNFSSVSIKDKLIAKSRNINQDRLDSHVNTSHALQYVFEQGFSINNGARPSARKIVVLISDGYWSDVIEIKQAIDKLSYHNITVFGIAAGLELSFRNFQDIFDDPCNLFYIYEDDSYALDVLASFTSFVYCD